jgi:hypothetical protein
VEIIAVTETDVSVGINVVSEGHVTQPPSAVVGQVVKEMSLLFCGELDNGNCDACLSVEEKGKQCIFDAVSFL